MEQTIEMELKELAVHRFRLEQIKLAIESAQVALEQTDEWKQLQSLIDARTTRANAKNEIEDRIKADAIANFTGDKHPVPGIEIKSFLVISINDQKAAVIWASQNAPACVKLDETKFKKVADALELPFVDKSNEFRAQIASDLSAYLEA